MNEDVARLERNVQSLTYKVDAQKTDIRLVLGQANVPDVLRDVENWFKALDLGDRIEKEEDVPLFITERLLPSEVTMLEKFLKKYRSLKITKSKLEAAEEEEAARKKLK